MCFNSHYSPSDLDISMCDTNYKLNTTLGKSEFFETSGSIKNV
jgi:hypothetical protein